MVRLSVKRFSLRNKSRRKIYTKQMKFASIKFPNRIGNFIYPKKFECL